MIDYLRAIFVLGAGFHICFTAWNIGTALGAHIVGDRLERDRCIDGAFRATLVAVPALALVALAIQALS